MSDDELIAALQTAVKQEVMERYVLERRIIEEEIHIVHETASAFHGGHSAWDRAKVHLASALIEEEAVGEFFAAAGLELPLAPPSVPIEGFPRPRALTREGRYLRLIAMLYRGLATAAGELEEELERVLKLVEEVNQDIRRFEADHDLLAISAYLRSLDINEIKRRKILGSNFTAQETLQGAAALSFKPIGVEYLELYLPESPNPPGEVLDRTKRLLKDVCRRRGREVEQLWRG